MSIREIVRFVVFFLVTAASVFLSAGTLAWWNGWLFMAVISAAVASVTFGIFRAAPELMRERRTAAKAAKPWDRALVPVMTGLPFVAVIVAGLGKRLGWASPFAEWSAWVAFGAMALGSAPEDFCPAPASVSSTSSRLTLEVHLIRFAHETLEIMAKVLILLR